MASGKFVREKLDKTVRNHLAVLKQGQASEGRVAQGECTSANGLQSLGAASPPVRRSDTARAGAPAARAKRPQQACAVDGLQR
jgi:hypothetical protein